MLWLFQAAVVAVVISQAVEVLVDLRYSHLNPFQQIKI
jgi:hypothetical protein